MSAAIATLSTFNRRSTQALSQRRLVGAQDMISPVEFIEVEGFPQTGLATDI
ncbi:MAG: hypothetical protein MUC60_03105 [Oscillatoria sp. Prado101]|nr:hypothetical protein [Oscillatoria sp. Prado101]